MIIKDFPIERYFAEHEFTAKYLLSSPDCDGYSMQYVLDQASPQERSRYDSLTLGYTETRGAAAHRTDPARLQELVTPQTKLIMVNFPHNPTGNACFTIC